MQDRVAQITETTSSEKRELYALFKDQREIAQLIESLRSFKRKMAWDSLLVSEQQIAAYAT